MMRRWTDMKGMGIAAAILGVVAATALTLTAAGHEDEGHEDHEHRDDERHYALVTDGPSRFAYREDAQHALYVSECGDCHMAYPPWLLTERAWRGVMGSLADHFGDNAELDAQTRATLERFLARHSADQVGDKHAMRILRSMQGSETVLRISETDYFRGQHHEIGRTMVEDNPRVGSFSRCEACHTTADQGSFREHHVRIPGHGRWDD